ncbi:MAG TPA: copper resistance protein CopC [Ktedonobacteraceae bacterium]|jgi:copper transport protein
MKRSKQTSWKAIIHRLVLMAFSLAFLLFFLFPQEANAHAILLRSDPAKDSILPASPDQIRMWFTEDLNPTFSTAYVVNAANSAANVQKNIKTHVDKDNAHVSATDSKEMDVSLKPNLPSAVYVVLYRTQSADDGHILDGSLVFTVAATNGTIPSFNGTLPQEGTFSGSGGSSGQLDGPTLFSFIMITLVDLGAVFWVGAQFWRIFVSSELQSEDQDQQAIFQQLEQRFDRHFSWLVLLLILLANIGVLVGQALTLTSDQWGQAFAPSLLISLVAHGQFGTFWIMRQIVILVALLLIVSTVVIKQPSQWITASISWGNFILGLALLIALTLSGHAAATSNNVLVYAVLGDFLHLVAASLWVGGMMYIAVIYLPILKSKPWQQQTASLLTTLPRYSPLAITGVVLMGLSGPLNAATRLLSWDQFFTTAYGRALVIKILLVGAMLVTSAIHVLLLRPRLAKDFKIYQDATEAAQPLEKDKPANQTPIVEVKELEERITQRTQRLSKILRWEPALGVAVLLCTGLLAVFSGTLQPTAISQPASQPQSAPSKPFTTTVETADQQFRVMVKIDPNHFGTNTFTATVFDSKGKPVPTSSIGVSLYTTMLDMDMGTDVVNLQPDGKGHFSSSGDLGMGGNWGLRIEIRTLDATLHEATLKFFTPY